MMYRTLDEALYSVNFKKVHAYMTVADWKWQGLVPTVEEMENTVRKLCHDVDVSERANSMASTGGFNVYKFTWDTGVVEYQIVFDIS